MRDAHAGAVLFTNDVDSLPTGEADHKGWKELAPGHYMCGRTITQFALSLDGLATRVHKESMDADALHAMLQVCAWAVQLIRTDLGQGYSQWFSGRWLGIVV